eukprot:TRINITY_DN14653_c0_g1_i1.p1 TRINITY_DN14653_c0_g1~~TRINITY_DN14653_c0_g1_i1.p1  ORF type:complete len:284 (+),score=57.09 TRINITY_DN14653_c0_g1_i1:80-853(+)
MAAAAPSAAEQARRSGAVAAGAAADIAVNYPPWIWAKRLGAGLPRPQLREWYKGGGALWFSTAPTMCCEDAVTRALRRSHRFRSLPLSGVAAAVTVASQVEHLIVHGHATGRSIPAAAQAVLREQGVVGLVLPYGIAATAAREAPYATALFYVAPWTSAAYARRWEELRNADGSPTVPGRMLAAYSTSMVTSPISHAPSVVAAYQQRAGVPLGEAVRAIHSAQGWSGFFAGVAQRTAALGGTLFVIPLVIDLLHGTH